MPTATVMIEKLVADIGKLLEGWPPVAIADTSGVVNELQAVLAALADVVHGMASGDLTSAQIKALADALIALQSTDLAFEIYDLALEKIGAPSQGSAGQVRSIVTAKIAALDALGRQHEAAALSVVEQHLIKE